MKANEGKLMKWFINSTASRRRKLRSLKKMDDKTKKIKEILYKWLNKRLGETIDFIYRSNFDFEIKKMKSV